MRKEYTSALIKGFGLCIAAFALVTCSLPSVTSPAMQSSSPEVQRVDILKVRKVGDVPDGESRFKLQFVNERDGWLADNKNVWRTTNGGASWEVVHSINRPKDMPSHIPAHRLKEYKEAFTEIKTFQFIDESLGYLQTSNGISMTGDGGKTWTQSASPLDFPKGELREFKFLRDGKVGWIVGGIYQPVSREALLRAPNNVISADEKAVLHGAIFRTDNGGITWRQQLVTPEMGRLLSLHFAETEHGWVAGDAGILYTEDGGKKWKASSFKDDCVDREFMNTFEGYSIDIYFVDVNIGWITYTDGYIAKSIDGGQTWCDLWHSGSVLPNVSYNTFFQEINFTDSAHGWGLRADGGLYETNNGGTTWVKVETNIRVEDMYFLNANLGWVVSKEGLFHLSS